MIPFNLPHNPKPPRPWQSRTPFGASWPRIIIFVMYDVLYLIRDPLIAFIIQHLPPFPSIVPSLPPPSLSLPRRLVKPRAERQRLLELIAVSRPVPLHPLSPPTHPDSRIGLGTVSNDLRAPLSLSSDSCRHAVRYTINPRET